MDPADGTGAASAEERAALARLHGRIAPRAGELVGAFYAGLRARAATREVLERLSAAEFTALQAHQARLLAELVAPDSAPRSLARAASHSGRVHALLGLGFATVVEAHGFYQRLLEDLVPDRVHLLVDGRVVERGGPELARQIEAA
ncbi:MAG: protoglobin domain-containing protein, partial [Acetobacteraceae bacterium]